MTNSEYFEKNGISFAKAMEIFNEQKSKKGGIASFDEFLMSKYPESKFKVGDLVVLQLTEKARELLWTKPVVFKIRYVHDGFYGAEALTPDTNLPIGSVRDLTSGFVEDNCVLY